MKPPFLVPTLLRRGPSLEKGTGRALLPHLRSTFYVDTTFLQRLQRELTPFDAEEAVLVGGVQVLSEHGEILCVPTSPFMPNYTSQSETGLEADRDSVSAICRSLADNGHKVVARFHSHPGSGIGMSQPSPRDIKDQMEWEQGGSLALSGIFTRSSHGSFFVRLFAISTPAVHVIGRAEYHGSNTWEIPDGAL